MTNEEIITNNTLIADFMNWVHHEDKNYDAHEMTTLMYHKSWDWLMSVVEKICKHKFNDEAFYIDTACLRTFGMIHQETGEFIVRFNRFALYQDKSLITATYNAIIDFIQWYNQTKTEHEK